MSLLEENRTVGRTEFLNDVITGLSGTQKTLPCRWLYDERGSKLFEDITQTEDYYPTRTETDILKHYAGEVANFVGPETHLIEYGAGAGVKTELLLKSLAAPLSYVPIDIAEEFLARTAARIGRTFPRLKVNALMHDFSSAFDLPDNIGLRNRVAFFPGSTIGNLTNDQTVAFLKQVRRHVGIGGKAIIGIDLHKDIDTLLRAYDDAEGVTAAFNLNLLIRINHEFGADFRIDRFEHQARWNESDKAVEMHLVSLGDQTVQVDSASFNFALGETIHTESSRKYSQKSFERLASAWGWSVDHFWTDRDKLFGVFGLKAVAESTSIERGGS